MMLFTRGATARGLMAALGVLSLTSVGGWCAPAPSDTATDLWRASENFMKNNKFKEAKAKLDQSIKENPQSAKAYADRGLANDKLGLYKDAIEDSTRAIQLDDKLLAGYVNRAWA